MPYDLNHIKKLKILFVEDDPVVRNSTTEILQIFFADVLIAHNGIEALEILLIEQPDIILSDIKMPKMDGLLLTQKIRSQHNTIPIILLSSYSDQETLLEAANSCIDGYILKPIELSHLLATIDKAIKRKTPIKKILQFSEHIIYDQRTHELFINKQSITLGKKERQMLEYFIHNSNRTISKQELINNVWELDEITDSALKNLLNRLRSKIGFDLIISVKGSGWRLKPFVAES